MCEPSVAGSGLEDVEFALLGYIDWFNTRRIHHQAGGVPPAEFEARYYNEYNELASYHWPELNE